MRVPPLIRRRNLWLPTWFGWLLLALTLIATAVILGRNLYRFLSPNEPVRAEVLVVEGWMPESALEEALNKFVAADFRFLVTSGGPITHWTAYVPFSTYAGFAADFYKRRGISPESVIAVPTPASAQNRTFLSAVMVREWAYGLAQPPSAINVYSYGPHARRTRLLYRLAFGPGVEIGILSATPDRYRGETWWRTSEGAKVVFTELIAWLWTACCFSRPERGSLEERWGRPETDR
ncbi:MAG: hypothetical protein GWN84_13320 [Gammaproteobacteria bacterium]|nr:hypothetical protein [Gammaproteobacteria bacterium]NIV51973.1 hypothetical protein [Gammaproteobacteria bacterium]NIV73390.1 hypothetical protein [Gammaproteobacteria bacterium]